MFNQTTPLTARGGDTASAEEDPRVRAGAQCFNLPATLNTSQSVFMGHRTAVSLGTWQPGSWGRYSSGDLLENQDDLVCERGCVLWMNMKLWTFNYTKALGKSKEGILLSAKHCLQGLLEESEGVRAVQGLGPRNKTLPAQHFGNILQWEHPRLSAVIISVPVTLLSTLRTEFTSWCQWSA